MAESKIQLTDRLRREGRWTGDAEDRKNEMIRIFREAGLQKAEASEEAWRRLAEEYPPLPPKPKPDPEPEPDAESDGSHTAAAASVDEGEAVAISPLPEAWGELPESAPFEAEVEWVHQNRVLVVEELAGKRSKLHWHRARKPAPSYGAVNLMEYAATNRKGFMDILQKVKPAAAGDEENVRRERRSIAEIEDLLEKMAEGE
ncbi:MAG: hypothetical protein LLG00_16640 [Planctomycetaceae bacterium]|nr:hypothetical protein [Planctomycetaceae bacterium]